MVKPSVHKITKKHPESERLPHSNPQASALAVQLKEQHTTASAYAQALCTSHFQNNQFSYSLRPPVLAKSRPRLTSSCLNTKIGFCGHYASCCCLSVSMLQVFRRGVVGGYQGGSWQVQGNYLAGAAKGCPCLGGISGTRCWRRFDATAIVAPLRLTQGLSEALCIYQSDNF